MIDNKMTEIPSSKSNKAELPSAQIDSAEKAMLMSQETVQNAVQDIQKIIANVASHLSMNLETNLNSRPSLIDAMMKESQLISKNNTH